MEMEKLILSGFSGVLVEIYKQISKGTNEAYEKLESRILNACHQYDKNYRDRHGQLKVFCVGMREPIPLDDVYVTVQFLEDGSALKYESLEDVERAFREDSERFSPLSSDERQDGTRVANDKRYLMVLGGPGVGKSTFLRKIGLEALKGKKGKFKHKCIPVFLELKRFTENMIDIEALITKEFEVCGYPDPDQMVKEALKSGKLLILFDGLDEVPTANVDNVIGKIGDFVDKYNQNRFIASCRIAAYTGGFTRFTEVEMADFNNSQIKVYIKNWFASTSDRYRRQLDEEMKTAERCWKALSQEEHQATKELARNPLLLTLLCMVYDNSQNFPRNRADLYEKALNIFLEEWAAEKRISRDPSVSQYLDISDEKRMLSEIAAKNFEEDRLFFRKNELIDLIKEFGAGNANTPPTFDASKVLDTILIDQGLFVERGGGFYSFSHLTFQEYLTANYIVGDIQSISGLVEGHLHDERWREVFLLTAGRMREADSLLLKMASEAAESINTDGLKALFRWAKRITYTSDDLYHGIAKRAFAIRQYLSLWFLDKTYEVIRHNQSLGLNLNCNFKFDPDFDFNCNSDGCNFDGYDFDSWGFDDFYDYNYDDLGFNPEFKLDRDSYLYQSLDLGLDRDLSLNLYRDLNLDLDLYLDLNLIRHQNFIRCQHLDLYLDYYRNLMRCLNLYLDLDFCISLYGYRDVYFYLFVSPEFGDRFEAELGVRVAFIERLERARIFKGIDLQQMVQRFKAQHEFIKTAREGKVVEPPEKSIHESWLSVLHITDDMLTISRDDVESYIQYLRTVQFIFECKEAAGRVSPKVWQQIEDRLLTADAADIKA